MNHLKVVANEFVKLEEKKLDKILGDFVSSFYITINEMVDIGPKLGNVKNYVFPCNGRVLQTIGDLNKGCIQWAKEEVNRRNISVIDYLIYLHQDYNPFNIGHSLFNNFRAHLRLVDVKPPVIPIVVDYHVSLVQSDNHFTEFNVYETEEESEEEIV